jgi:NADH:ubiquinone oxidoreductase subunit E
MEKVMAVKEVQANEIKNAVHDAVQNHGAEKEELIPVLLEVNEHLGFLPTAAMAEISNSLRVPLSRVYSVASFYSMLATEPRGRHVIQFCESAPCHVMGGRKLIQALCEHLALDPGETSPDGKWSLVMTSCVGACSVGPVLLVDDDVYGNVTASMLTNILSQYE